MGGCNQLHAGAWVAGNGQDLTAGEPSPSSCCGENADGSPDEYAAASGTGLPCCGVPALALTGRLIPVVEGSIS